MKKITILFIVLFNFSCKDNLPKNISDQVLKVNQMIKIVNKYDSTLMAMDENYISNLGLDSLRSFSDLYSTTIQTYYHPAKEKLDEMLIPNAQYSNHPAIINLDKFYREKDKKKFEDNLNFINNRLNYIIFNGKEKPKYGDQESPPKINF
jgi:hypothetical protein